MRFLLLAIALATSGCSSCSGRPDAASSKTPPGAVTLRFQNKTSADIYVNGYATAKVTQQDGTILPGRTFCHSECNQCSCNTCGSQLPTVRRIEPGGSIDIVWKGDFFEPGRCTQGATNCNCDQTKYVVPGTYTVELGGARGRTSDAGESLSPNIFEGDPIGPVCKGTKTIGVTMSPQTIEIPFECSP
jgi:hypothetical protein